MPWVLEVEVVHANSIIFMSLQIEKKDKVCYVFFSSFGVFLFFSIFLLCWVKPKGQEIIKIRPMRQE